MLRNSLLVLLAASMLTGCINTANKQAYMEGAAAYKPEGARLWSRPQEVGYNIGSEITGQATNVSLFFGLISLGADDGGVMGSLGGIFGGGGVDDPLVRAAAGVAVNEAGSGTDGIYVTHHEVTCQTILIYKRRVANVTGRALTLRPIGEVTEQRADQERMLQAISEGQPQLQMPTTGLLGGLF